MNFLGSQLNPEERRMTYEFLHRLDDTDGTNVQRVVNSIDRVATDYFRTESPLMMRPDFFAVYLVGGQLTKQGESPDIDLLAATSAYWTSGFPPVHDPVCDALTNEFTGCEVLKEGELPNNYNLGRTKGRVLIRLAPEAGKRIDVIYVRSMRNHDTVLPDERVRYEFASEEEFAEKDVSDDGTPLPRLALYRRTAPRATLPLRSSLRVLIVDSEGNTELFE